MNVTHTRRVAALAVAAVSLAAAPSALADKADKADKPEKTQKPVKAEAQSGGACEARTFATVFSSFNDNALYTLAPDGDFEAGATDWTLSHGASVAAESSSILLGDALGAQSLELAAGAAATTPPICVAHGFPSFRFVTRSADGGVLRVQVLYGAGRKSKKTGRIKARAAWKVTRKLSLAQGRFRVKHGESAQVRLKFTASRGTVRMDDVYVDPRFRR